MKILFVAGTFDDNGGKPSGYMNKVVSEIQETYFGKCEKFKIYNGGSWDKMLTEIFPKIAELPEVIFWFANIPNEKVKLVQQIKTISPKSLLVISKNNMDGKYSVHYLVAKMLKLHANLMLEIGGTSEKILSSVYDPLGNCFAKDEDDTKSVALTLTARICDIMNYNRIGSKCIGLSLIHI